MVDSTNEPAGSATTRPRKAIRRPARPPTPVADKAPMKEAGEKTAAKLVNAYGSIDGIYAHIDDISGRNDNKNWVTSRRYFIIEPLFKR